jgi:FkbM family methyltransferase
MPKAFSSVGKVTEMASIIHSLYSSKLRNYTRKLGLNRAIAYVISMPERWREQKELTFYRNNQPDRYSNTYEGQHFSLMVESETDYLRCQLFRLDRHLIDGLLQHAQKGDVFWDVGANFGLYSICAARKVGNEGHIYSFDPIPWCCERIKQNAEINQIKNIKVLDVALSDQSARFTIQDGSSPVTGTCRLEPQTDQGNESLPQVQAMSGAEVLASGRAQQPNVIKIDVEGHEIQVLKGLTEILASPNCRALLVEIHFTLLERMGIADPVNQITNLLSQAGLKVHHWLDASHLLALRQ